MLSWSIEVHCHWLVHPGYHILQTGSLSDRWHCYCLSYSVWQFYPFGVVINTQQEMCTIEFEQVTSNFSGPHVVCLVALESPLVLWAACGTLHGGPLLGLFLPFHRKLRVLGPRQVECLECNETWQASRLINYLFIGVYFIPCDCYCDVIYCVQIWRPKENSGKK